MEQEYQLDEQASELIHGNIETTMQVLEHLPGSIGEGAALITQCLLSEQKVLCCGAGQSAALAQLFTSNLLNRLQYERPALPAVNLSSDAATLTGITSDNSFQQIFANQIRALGQPGDLLLLIGTSSSNALLQAIQAAHDRQLGIVAITSQSSQDIGALLHPEDLELCVPSDNRTRISEGQLLIINCICELIDQQLFGGY